MSGDKRVLPALLVAVVWLVLWAARPGVAQGPGPEVVPAQFTADQADRGRAEYERSCASCHGANLEGQPKWQEKLPTSAVCWQTARNLKNWRKNWLRRCET